MKKIGFTNNDNNAKAKFMKNVNRLSPGHSPAYHGNLAVECQKRGRDDHQGHRRFKIYNIDEHGTKKLMKSNLTMKSLRQIIG